MQLQYEIVPEDYIAFNLHFAAHDPVIQNTYKRARTLLAALVLGGGLLLMFFLNMLNAWAFAVYGLLALVVYLYTPKYLMHRMKKGVRTVLKRPNAKSACSEKIFTMDAETCNLSGGGEDSTYGYDAFQKVVTDEKHYYLYLDDVSALIIPFRAFADNAQQEAFYSELSAKMAANKA